MLIRAAAALRRYTAGHGSLWYLRDDAAGGDHGARADLGPRQHGHARREPRAVADVHWPRFEQRGAGRLADAGNLRVCDDGVIADHDVAANAHVLVRGDQRAVVDERPIGDLQKSFDAGDKLDCGPIRVEPHATADDHAPAVFDVRAPEGPRLCTDAVAVA